MLFRCPNTPSQRGEEASKHQMAGTNVVNKVNNKDLRDHAVKISAEQHTYYQHRQVCFFFFLGNENYHYKHYASTMSYTDGGYTDGVVRVEDGLSYDCCWKGQSTVSRTSSSDSFWTLLKAGWRGHHVRNSVLAWLAPIKIWQVLG